MTTIEIEQKISPADLPDMSNRELISTHTQLHRFWEKHFAGNTLESSDGSSREDIVNAAIFLEEEMQVRGIPHAQHDELDKQAAALTGRYKYNPHHGAGGGFAEGGGGGGGEGGGVLAPELESALGEWTSGATDTDWMRGEVENAMNGRPANADGQAIAKGLKKAPMNSDIMHRGMRMSENDVPQVGKTMDIPMASVSKRRDVALEFAQGQYRETGSHPVMVQVIGPRKQLRIPGHLMPKGYEDAESLITGKFVVRDSKRARIGNEDGFEVVLVSLVR